MAKKKIDKEAMVESIIEWSKQSIGHSIDLAGVRHKVDGPDGEDFLREAAEFCGIELIYE